MALLLDLDGTLIDSKPGIAASIRVACAETGLAQPDEATLHEFIGPPLGYSLEVHYGLTDRAFVDGFVAAYRRSYLAEGMRNGAIYPGMEDVLAEFRRRGERLFVATSKPRVHAATMLDDYGLARCFDAIHGSELDGGRFDKAELIAHILASESLHAGEAIMVGDRRFDIEGAIGNGIAAVAALWGYGGHDELSRAGATEFCERPADLPARVDEIRAAALQTGSA